MKQDKNKTNDLVGRESTNDNPLQTSARSKSPKLYVRSDELVLRNPQTGMELENFKKAAKDAMLALGANDVRLGCFILEDDGDYKLPIRINYFKSDFFDSVHLDVKEQPEVTVTFFLKGDYTSSPKDAERAVETPEFKDAAQALVRLLHPKSNGTAFVNHSWYKDGSGHSTVSFFD
jgi:hypothetical protein